MRQMTVGGQIDENGSLPYKPRQLSALTRSVRGGSFWAGIGPFWPASIRGLTSLIRQIVSLSGTVVSGEQPRSGLISPANWCASAVTASAPHLQLPAACWTT